MSGNYSFASLLSYLEYDRIAFPQIDSDFSLFSDVSITSRNVAFDQVWQDEYALASGAMFSDFANNIDRNVRRI